MTTPKDIQAKASRLEKGLLLCALGFYALALPLCAALFRPGWAAYDEESLLDQVQAWREGHGLIAGFAWGSLYRGLDVLLVAVAGPHLALLHGIGLAAIEAEALLLYAWLREPLGQRAALWAALTDLVCTATFARGASLLSVSLLPAAFLTAALACGRLRRPRTALLWGLGAGLMLLDYEGWAGALLFLLPYATWRWRDRKALFWTAVLGFAAGLVVVWRLSPDLVGHVLSRREVSAPDQGFVRQCLLNLQGLLSGGDRLAISAAAGWPWPAPWIWPLLLLGALGLRRGLGWPAWLFVCGALPLGLADTSYEPHRLCLALLALAAFAGNGAATLWRRPWGICLCLALLVAGAASEIRAWGRTPVAKLELSYGTSRNLEQAARWMSANQPSGGWRLVSGLSYHNDGAFRFLLAGEGVSCAGRDPVALLYWDDLPGLKSLKPGFKVLAFGGPRPVALVLLPPKDASRLEAVSASLESLHWAQISQTLGVQCAMDLHWLKAPGHGDPWARTVAWNLWLETSLQTRNVDLSSAETLLGEPLVCGWAPDVLAVELARTHPALAQRFKAKAEEIDPRRRAMTQQERTARY